MRLARSPWCRPSLLHPASPQSGTRPRFTAQSPPSPNRWIRAASNAGEAASRFYSSAAVFATTGFDGRIAAMLGLGACDQRAPSRLAPDPRFSAGAQSLYGFSYLHWPGGLENPLRMILDGLYFREIATDVYYYAERQK